MNDEHWQFPEVKASLQGQSNHLVMKNELELSLEIQQKELAKLKADYEFKLNLLSEIAKNLHQSEIMIVEDTMKVLLEIIAKSIKEIIHQEIKQEPTILLNMIEVIKKTVQEDGTVKVYLSNHDKQLLEPCDTLGLMIDVDAKLTSGDIIVTSNISNRNAILMERIESLLRT